MKEMKKRIIAIGVAVVAAVAAIVAVVVLKGQDKKSESDTTTTEAAATTEEAPTLPSNALVFEASQLTQREWNDGSAVLENDKYVLTFPAQYDEVIFDLPGVIDLAKCEQVIFQFEDQSTPLSLKLRNDETETSDTVYGMTGATEYIITPTSEQMINAIGIMISDSPSEPATATFIRVTFMMQEGYELSTEMPKPEVQKDIPNWKDAITDGLGEGTIAASALSNDEISDEKLMELVTKHYNAITLENELKPDATFGYSNDVCPGTEEVELNGETITVPVMDHSLAEKMLDAVLEWNAAHPESPLKVRGHVLVWHSQTPEWFFHEDYDAKKPLVTPEEMDKRQEWYIKAQLTYFVGEDSKYKDLFYGWDVVNEAVSDSTGTYRSDAEGSSWWKVYQDESFIINAFKYANKYAPAEVELYYNDYNECVGQKQEGIVKLLKAVKAAEGEPGVGTRISGMGMQGHHDLYSPTIGQIESAARAYAAVVNNIQITELDIKANGTYDGTSATRSQVYNTMAYRYKEIFDTMKALKDDGINVTGITVWGVIDSHSWLNDAANVGGGANGVDMQCPLLFDGEYQAKPAFWGFVDPSMLEPAIQKVTVIEYQDETFSDGNAYTFEQDDTSVTVVPMWTADGLKIQVTVVDSTEDASDAITVYVDADNSKSESATIQKVEVKRSDAEATDDGYRAVVDVAVSGLTVGTVVGFDVRVIDGNKQLNFNDLKQTQDTTSVYYAEAKMKPYVSITKGTVEIDGEMDEAWENAVEIPLQIDLGVKVTSTMRLLWDGQYLYWWADVKDSDLNKMNTEPHQQDSVEIFIDENNHKTDAYEEDDKQYRVNFSNKQTFNGKKCTAANMESFAKKTDDGYIVEARFKWTDVTPYAGMVFGLELQVNDADCYGYRLGTLSWYDETGTGWTSPAVFGNAKLVD